MKQAFYSQHYASEETHLDLEDLDIGGQKVLPLHALLPGHGPDQERGVHVIEGFGRLGSGDHA